MILLVLEALLPGSHLATESAWLFLENLFADMLWVLRVGYLQVLLRLTGVQSHLQRGVSPQLLICFIQRKLG